MQQPHKRRRKKKKNGRVIIPQTIEKLKVLLARITDPRDRHELEEAIRLLQKLMDWWS
jgi:hypothetical protein